MAKLSTARHRTCPAMSAEAVAGLGWNSANEPTSLSSRIESVSQLRQGTVMLPLNPNTDKTHPKTPKVARNARAHPLGSVQGEDKITAGTRAPAETPRVCTHHPR